MLKNLGLGVVVVLSSLATRALAGPAWCPPRDQLPFGPDDGWLAHADLKDQISAVVYLECTDPERVGQPAVTHAEQVRQKLMARLGMTDADWPDAVDLAARIQAHEDLSIDLANPSPAWSTMGPLDQAAVLMYPRIEGGNLIAMADLAYIADAFGPKLSESARVVYVKDCVESKKPVQWAMCQGDVDALDGTKLASELHAATAAPPYARMAIRVLYDELKQELPAHAKDVKQVLAKDPAYGQLFAIASAQRTAWNAVWSASPPALAAALAMDDGVVTHSRRAVAGCQQSTWNTLAAAVTKVPAKAFALRATSADAFADDAVEDLVVTLLRRPETYLAAAAYTSCAIQQHTSGALDDIANRFAGELVKIPGYRGPRTSTQSEILFANIQLDDRDATLDQPDFTRHWFTGIGNVDPVEVGNMASLKRSGDHATLVFAAQPATELVDTGCTQTHRIHSIRGDGSIEYEYNCTGSKRISVDHRPDPATVAVRYTHHLGARMAVIVEGDVVFFAWHGNAKVPSVVLGVPVK